MKNLDLFKKVQRVEAPPFLLTRIHAKIRAAEAERLPVSWRWAGALVLGLLLFFNAQALKTGQGQSSAPVGQVAESFGMLTSNQLYDE
jgi:hypothetical protein